MSRDASSFSGTPLPRLDLRHAPATDGQLRRRGVRLEPRATLIAPVAAEIVRRSAASAVGGAITANAIASVAHGPLSQAGNTLVWYSLAGMLSASFGVSMLPVAKYAWERLEHLLAPQQETGSISQEPIYLYGVDTTCSRYLNRPEVIRAAQFAAAAHEGQKRMTGDPYIVHCVETAAIVECLHATSKLDEMDERVEAAVLAALLHDVVDDTRVSLEEVHAEFGPRIARIVGQVAQLSTTTQLLRRRRRTHNEIYVGGGSPPPELSREEEADLRNMILAMVDEPLVLVVKLADRLHNMRTVYALRPDRQRAVAIETMQVWCSLAERLGMFALKSELEDLCFAVMNPREYRALRSELDTIWGLPPLSPTSIADAADKVLASMDMPATDDSATSSSADTASTSPVIPSAVAAPPTSQLQTLASLAGDLSASAVSSNILEMPNAVRSMSFQGGGALAAAAASPGMQAQEAVCASESLSSAASISGRERMSSRASAAVSMPGTSSTSLHSQAASVGAAVGGMTDAVAGMLAASSSAEERSGGESHSGRAARPRFQTPEQEEAWELIQTVLPFHAVTFRSGAAQRQSRAVLDVLDKCAHRLLYELKMEGLATGLDVHVEGRIKSLYSMYRKMIRKGVSLREVFDALALRVVVDDQNGTKMQRAIEACYEIQPAVHRLWRPIRGELDDYIFNPKASGYQSLHSAVIGPVGVPMEVQIRTSSMHEIAEYGAAAHWAYKDSPQAPVAANSDTSEDIKVGQPMVRVSTGKLQLGVVVDIAGDKLLVAVIVPSRVMPDTSIDKNQVKTVLAYVRRKKFWAPGHGDLHLSLESYMLCKDGYWHLVDSYNKKQPPFVMPLQNVQKDFDGAEASHQGHAKLTSAEARKVRLLRRMLEWQRDLLGEPEGLSGEAGPGDGGGRGEAALPQSSQVQVLIVPTGKIEQVQRGTTAGDIIRQKGRIEIEKEGRRQIGPRLVNVNNHLVPESTPLGDGDWVSLSPELLDI
ncbi:g4051 [Coccomyxa elongata]